MNDFGVFAGIALLALVMIGFPMYMTAQEKKAQHECVVAMKDRPAAEVERLCNLPNRSK